MTDRFEIGDIVHLKGSDRLYANTKFKFGLVLEIQDEFISVKWPNYQWELFHHELMLMKVSP